MVAHREKVTPRTINTPSLFIILRESDIRIVVALARPVLAAVNLLGLQFIEDDLRAEIAWECTAAGFSSALLENVAKLSK